MKTSTILAGMTMLIVVSQASFANQPNDTKRPDMAALATQLQLDEGKTQQLETIMQNFREERKRLHSSKQKSREDMRSMRKQHREQLLTVLDHKQLYQLEEYMQQFRPKGKSHKKSD